MQQEKTNSSVSIFDQARERLKQEDQDNITELFGWSREGVEPNVIVDEARKRGLLNRPETVDNLNQILGDQIDFGKEEEAFQATFANEVNNAYGDGIVGSTVNTIGAGTFQGLSGIVGLGARVSDVVTGRDDADFLNRTLDAISNDAGTRGKWRQYTQGAVSNITQMSALGKASEGIGAISKLSKVAKYLPYAGMATVVTNQSYTKGKDAGLSDGDALAYAVEQGTAEFAFNALFHGLSRKFPKLKWLAGTEDAILNPKIFRESFKKGLGDSFKTFIKSQGVEQIEEGLVSFTQAAIDKFSGVNPEALTSENITEMVMDTVAQTFLTGTASHGVNIAGWVKENPAAVLQLLAEKNPSSRKAFTRAGLNDITKAEDRKSAVDQINTIMSDDDQNVPSGIDAPEGVLPENVVQSPSEPENVDSGGLNEASEAGKRVGDADHDDKIYELPGGLSKNLQDGRHGKRNSDYIDGLTGILKADVIKEEMAQHEDDENSSLLFLDIDDFKAVNEIFGHSTGDDVLSTFGDLLNKHFGGKDSPHAPGREGGEEFVVKVDTRDPELKNKIKAFIDEAHDITVGENEPISVSGGLMRGGNVNEKGNYDANADKLLLEAKEAGKNRVKVDIGGNVEYIEGRKHGRKNYVRQLDLQEIERRAKRLLEEPETLSPGHRESLSRTLQAVGEIRASEVSRGASEVKAQTPGTEEGEGTGDNDRGTERSTSTHTDTYSGKQFQREITTTEGVQFAPERFQFKRNVESKRGIKEGHELKGPVDVGALGQMVFYEDADGSRYVVSGHHRLDLLRRTGQDIDDQQAMILKESEGWTEDDAKAFGARLNIKEGGGEIDDYAAFIRFTDISEEKAEANSLLNSDKAKKGFAIGKYAGEDLYAMYLDGKIKDNMAAIIAKGAPDNAEIQAEAIKQSKSMTQESLELWLNNIMLMHKATKTAGGATQGSLFGDAGSQETIRNAKKVAALQLKKIKEVNDRANGLKGLLRGGKKLTEKEKKALGVAGMDNDGIQEQIDILEKEKSDWENAHTSKELMDKLYTEAGLDAGPLADSLFEDKSDDDDDQEGGAPVEKKDDKPKPTGGLFANKPEEKAAKKAPAGNAMAALTDEDSFEQKDDKKDPDEESIPADTKKEVKRTPIKDTVGAVLELTSPAHVDDVSRKAGHIFRKEMAAAAQKDEVIVAALSKYESTFSRMKPEEAYDFIDKMETGAKQETPELEEIAKVLREHLDKGREEVQKIGQLKEYIEDYFPHIWEHPDEAKGVITSVMSKKSFKSGGFLKQRKYMTFKDGLDAGLTPVTDNPIEMTVRRLSEMNKYVMRVKMMDELKQSGLLKFVPASLDGDSYIPSGYEHYDDPAFTVATKAGVTASEAYDKLLVDQLMAVLSKLGIGHKRVAKIKGKVSTWGVSYKGGGDKNRPGNIQTRFAGPESVIAHELGHQIGDMYGLFDYLTKEHKQRKKLKVELRAVADLRTEGLESVQPQFKKYIRKRAEKEAAILEAWLAAPDKMEKVAPTLTKVWKEFLNNHSELQPLLNLDRSVVLGTRSQEIEQPGVRVLGRWSMPREVATMVGNMLSPGLRGNKNIALKGAYRLARYVGNAMNQASLAFSFFHGLNVMTDAINSQMGLGLQQLTRLEVGKGLKNIASSPMAGFSAMKDGDALIKAMRTDLEKINNPKLVKAIESVIEAGGRASMDTMYHNHAIKGINESVRNILHGDMSKKFTGAVKLPAQAIFAGLEFATKPVMEYMVPRLKLGVFYKLSQDVYARAETENLDDFQVSELLTQAWDSVDNRMGQLAYDNLFWNQYLKDASMLAVRSVGWNLGSWREFGGAAVDIVTTGKRLKRGDQILSKKMSYSISAVVTYSALGALLQYAFTGEPPEEPKDYFFPKTGRRNPDGSDERLSLPTYSKDWVGWTTDPVKTASHKLHPMWGTLSEMLNNQDYYGTKIRNEDDPIMQQLTDVMSHAFESFIPFSAKNFGRMTEAGESTPLAAVMAFSGISSAPGYIVKTPAQKLATQMLADRMPRGTRTKEKAEQTKRRWQLIKLTREGKPLSKEDVAGLTSRQIKSIRKAGQLTPFQSQFKRLTFEEALNVFNASNKEERESVFKLLLKKRRTTRTRDEDVFKFFNELVKAYRKKAS
jgi:diguanylate cyclase (GGDEF)-like protein